MKQTQVWAGDGFPNPEKGLKECGRCIFFNPCFADSIVLIKMYAGSFHLFQKTRNSAHDPIHFFCLYITIQCLQNKGTGCIIKIRNGLDMSKIYIPFEIKKNNNNNRLDKVYSPLNLDFQYNFICYFRVTPCQQVKTNGNKISKGIIMPYIWPAISNYMSQLIRDCYSEMAAIQSFYCTLSTAFLAFVSSTAEVPNCYMKPMLSAGSD